MKAYRLNFELLNREMKRKGWENADLANAIYNVARRGPVAKARIEAWKSGHVPDAGYLTALIEVFGWWDLPVKELFKPM